jgi:hypothetical protein
MTNSLKLLLFVLESCRPGQVDEPLELAREENLALTGVAAEAVKTMMDYLCPASRLDAVRQFREMGINLEDVV